jgi:two-component system NtrC family sensor kinase
MHRETEHRRSAADSVSVAVPTSFAPGTTRRYRHTLSLKLIALLLAALLITFSLLGYANIRLHRQHLERATLIAAERVSDTIKHATAYHMLHNDRDALYSTMRTMAAEPGIVSIRIFDSTGQIGYSTDSSEIGRRVNMSEEACYGCHSQAAPLSLLNRPDRFRIYRASGSRVLGIINPIENRPACSNAECHAHPANQQILGVLDTNLSLQQTDANLRESTWKMTIYTLLAVIFISLLSWAFIWRLVYSPVTALTAGTERLMEGDLGYQIPRTSYDELGELADSFNMMSLRLRDANEEITSWARTLEDRVEQKANELNRAHEQIVQVEKMASIGKLAAVVAHEVNNPLSGILTYAKLLKRWIDRGELSEDRHPEKLGEARQCLDLIESESRRCGDLVRNLLTFSRSAPINLTWVDLNPIAERCLLLVNHQLEMNNIQWEAELDPNLPQVHCDGAQMEQVLLVLVMNAIDAMPRGGNLRLSTRYLPQNRQVEMQVRDDGTGIDPELLPKLFEPFVTTKEVGKGVGLGLAVSKGIVARHQGQIEVESEMGRGTCFHVFLPVDAAGSTPPDRQSNAAGA